MERFPPPPNSSPRGPSQKRSQVLHEASAVHHYVPDPPALGENLGPREPRDAPRKKAKEKVSSLARKSHFNL